MASQDEAYALARANITERGGYAANDQFISAGHSQNIGTSTQTSQTSLEEQLQNDAHLPSEISKAQAKLLIHSGLERLADGVAVLYQLPCNVEFSKLRYNLELYNSLLHPSLKSAKIARLPFKALIALCMNDYMAKNSVKGV